MALLSCRVQFVAGAAGAFAVAAGAAGAGVAGAAGAVTAGACWRATTSSARGGKQDAKERADRDQHRQTKNHENGRFWRTCSGMLAGSFVCHHFSPYWYSLNAPGAQGFLLAQP